MKKEKPHEKIRQEMIEKIKDERVRTVVFSSFEAKPIFEHIYYDHIATTPEYFEMYKKWVLSQGPWPIPNDIDLYLLRKGILGVPGNIADGAKVNINRRLLFLFIDIIRPFIENILEKTASYYGLEKPLTIESDANVKTAINAIMFCDQENVEKSGYPNMIVAFGDIFKHWLVKEIGLEPRKFSGRDALFIKQFEKEWVRLYPYSDFMYGFEVVPAFLPEDTFRYLRLPFSAKAFGRLKKKAVYRQAMNYVVSLATFRPLPDPGIKSYYKKELSGFFTPLVKKEIDGAVKGKQFLGSDFEKEQLKKDLEMDLKKITSEFDFFYASTNNLKKQKLSPFDNLFIPMRGVLAKLGHIFASDQYPFTDYLPSKLIKKTKAYFASDDLNQNDRSMNEVINKGRMGNGDKEIKLQDTLQEDWVPASRLLPHYDAKDSDGKEVGWKIKTFAGFIGRDMKTLQRWDREGILKPQRYMIFSRKRRKKVLYRAYTTGDVKKARVIVNDMDRKMKQGK